MSRQNLLIALLIVVAVAAAPFYYFDRQAAKLKKEKAAIDQEMGLLKEKAAATKDLEARLAGLKSSSAAMDTRLLGSDPFAEMQRELTAAAGRAGVTVVGLKLTGAEPVKGLPLDRYTATVELSGSLDGLIAFVEILERDPLLIEIPDLYLRLPKPGAAGSAAEFRPTLDLHFFGRGAATSAASH